MVEKDADPSCSVSPTPTSASPNQPKSTKTSGPAPTTAATNTLPPCRVCGENASGFHYGVNTCEACKGFFRRSLQRKQLYKCSGSGHCKIGIGKRSNCPSCRYNKCISVGMSKSAIKTGRYTHEKRTQDILEVKQMQKSTSPLRFALDPIASSLQTSSSGTRASPILATAPHENPPLPVAQQPCENPTSPVVQGPASPTPAFQLSSSTTSSHPGKGSSLPADLMTLEDLQPVVSAFSPFHDASNDTVKPPGAEKVNQDHQSLSNSADLTKLQDLLPLSLPFQEYHSALEEASSKDKQGPARSAEPLSPVLPTVSSTVPVTPSDSQSASDISSNSSSDNSQSLNCFDLVVAEAFTSSAGQSMTPEPVTLDTSSPCQYEAGPKQQTAEERMPSMIPLSTQMPPTPPYDPQDYDSIIDTLIEAHKSYMISHTYTPREEILRRQVKYHEEFQQKEAMFGSLSTLSQEQYMDIFRQTGIDIDNRQATIGFFASMMENGLKRYISFVKMIPGFTDLPIDDQAALVKAARYEVWFCGSFPSFNSDLWVVSLPSGKNLHIKEMSGIWDEEFCRESFRVAKSFQKLKLLPDEFVLIKCICLTFADRCVLKEPGMVEAIQWKLTQCLMHLLKKNHPGDRGIFAQVIDRITELRSLTETNYKISRNLQIWPAIHQNPIIMEMISV